jgi:hypothetical protein
MRLYFDTSIYSYVAATGESHDVRRLLTDRACSLIASRTNIFEIYAIPRRDTKQTELRCLAQIATDYPRFPVSYRQAQEVLGELRRLRPEWVKPAIGLRRVREFLRAYRDEWKRVQEGVLPSTGFAVYRRDFEAGCQENAQLQKLQRSAHLKRDRGFTLAVSDGRRVRAIERYDFADPEQYWRLSSLQCWHNAVVQRHPASRDYADWLNPHITNRAMHDSASYSAFWLRDVQPERVQLNRIMGLAEYYQLSQKVTHGNPNDALHANHLMDCDLFLTSDKGLFRTLLGVRQHVADLASVVLVTRSAPSALAEIGEALDSAKPGAQDHGD